MSARTILFSLCLASFVAGCGDDSSSNTSSDSQTASTTSSSGAGANGGSGASGANGSGGSGAVGGGGGSGAGYEPDPIPEIDPEPDACDNPVKEGLQFLDDTCAVKRSPSFEDRDLACPIADDSATIELAEGGTVTYLPSGNVEVESDALAGIVPDELRIAVILIRRVNGVPHYRYLSNGNHDDIFQPWSSSKFLAAANAAARIRIVSDQKVGLTASVEGIPLGDLVTSMHRYDWDPYSSNSIGRYFHDVGGRERANNMIHEAWLGRSGDESFGGNYAEQAPPLEHTFEEENGESISVNPDGTAGPSNRLSTFTTAEALKRFALYREEPNERYEGLEWEDMATLLYGAKDSAKYGAWGGMAADKAIYMQSSHDMDYIEARSNGRWRIFSKLGNGSEGQLVNVGYACFPVLDPENQPVPGWGREFVISAQIEGLGDTWAERDRILARAFRAVVIRIVDGRL